MKRGGGYADVTILGRKLLHGSSAEKLAGDVSFQLLGVGVLGIRGFDVGRVFGQSCEGTR